MSRREDLLFALLMAFMALDEVYGAGQMRLWAVAALGGCAAVNTVIAVLPD